MVNVFAPAPRARIASHPEGLLDVFDELAHNVNWDNESDVRLGALLNAVGRRSYGPLLLILGLFAISPATIVPGMTWAAAAVVFLIAVQMAFGMQRPWLPRQILNMRAPRQPLARFLERARPAVDRMDGVWLRPRLTFLAQPPFVNGVALLVIAAALITIPLGLIPFAPLAPGFAIVLFGLGMTARDGLWLALGGALFLGALWLALPLIFQG